MSAFEPLRTYGYKRILIRGVSMRISLALALLAITSCDSKPQQAPLSAVPPLQLVAGQELVATCGRSAGHSYYPAIGISKEKSGWSEDGIAEGFRDAIPAICAAFGCS